MHSRMRPSLPSQDAIEYIGEILSLCAKESDGDVGTSKDEPEDVEPWEEIAEGILEHPELLVEMGLLTRQELRESDGELDEEWVQELAFALYVDALEREWTSSVSEFDYEGRAAQGDYTLDWFEEELIRLQDLMDTARGALSIGDRDLLISTIDAIYDEVGWEPESLGQVDNWAELLVASPPASGQEDNFDGGIRRLVVQAVRNLAVRLCELIARDKKALKYIEWRQLEEVIAVALEGIGFDVTLTSSSRDGGKDVIASCIMNNGSRRCYLIEIKHWRSGKRVGARPVLDFIEINVQFASDGGLFLASSGFSPSILTHLVELEPSSVRLGDEGKIVGICQHFSRRGRGIWTPDGDLSGVLFEGTLGCLGVR